MKGIISRPGFDKNVFKVGMAIRAIDHGNNGGVVSTRLGLRVTDRIVNAIIVKVNDFSIIIDIANGESGSYSRTIDSSQVASGEIEIKFLVPEEDK